MRGKYSIWDELLPQSSEPRHKGRTAYFYRKMAIAFAQDARRTWLNRHFAGYTETHAQLAKSYLASYRKVKAGGVA